MNRYYICRRVGTGIPNTGSPFTSELRVYIQNTYGIKAKQQVIAHVCPFVLMKYDLTQAQHDDVMANVPQVFSFPSGALDRTVSDIPLADRNAINNKLTAMGFSTGWITGATTVREVLQYLSHSIQIAEWLNVQISNQNFDIQKTVGDIPAARRAILAERAASLGIDTSGVTLTTPIWQVIRLFQRQADGITPRLIGTRHKTRVFYHDSEAEPPVYSESFNTPGPNTSYGFDGYLFGWSNQQWARLHQASGGVGNGACFKTVAGYDAIDINTGGTNHFFNKQFTGPLAAVDNNFWVRQCWKYSSPYLSGIDPFTGTKLNYFIGGGGGIITYAPVAGAFQAAERIVGATSGAGASIFSPDQNGTRATNLSGTFQNGETITGQTSGATAVFGSYAPEDRTITFNHFWHIGWSGYGWADNGLVELAFYDITSDAYFGCNQDSNLVQHTNRLVLQEHYNEWICIETRFRLDQSPWLVEIYVTTEWGAANLQDGATGMNGAVRHFNNHLYLRYNNTIAPALQPGFGVDSNEYGSFGMVRTGEEIWLDEYAINTVKMGHPF